MARLVKHERSQPYLIQEAKLPIVICACGLSKNKPHCDGSHKKTQGEKPGEIFVYDDAGRVAAKTEY